MVPENIRSVSRPKNTVVVDTKTKGTKRYIVRERIGYKKSQGNYSGPRNGKIIGYIMKDKFVPRDETKTDVLKSCRVSLQYGPAAFIAKECDDIHNELLDIFVPEDANRIMSIASLRVIDPGISCYRYKSKYEGTFLPAIYPCVGLSKNSVVEFLQKLGTCRDAHKQFYALRMSRVAADQNIFIDGVLKQDTGNNDLSRDSAKTHLKGHREISVIYAYNHDLSEVLCSKVYQGNMLDASAFHDFIESNGITKGTIVCDKGFPISKVRDLMNKYPHLHYIAPYKRNTKLIDEHDMTVFTSCSTLENGVNVLCKKVDLKNGKFLYSIRDMSRASAEQHGLINKGLKNDGDFDGAAYAKKILRLGLIVFESDLDLDPLDVLNHYLDRWWLELVFDLYKNELDLDVTRVQSRESVIGNEFINFVALLITCKFRKAFKQVDELYGKDGSTFASRMSELRDVHRDVDAPVDASLDDGHWILPASSKSLALIARLGLAKDPSGEWLKLPHKREVKRTDVDSNTDVSADNTCASELDVSESKELAPSTKDVNPMASTPAKRGPGRPKGSLNKKTLEALRSQGQIDNTQPKRGRGRPKGSLNKKTIEALKDHSQQNEKSLKRGRGRPKGSPNKISGDFKRSFFGPMPFGVKHPAIRKNTNTSAFWP